MAPSGKYVGVKVTIKKYCGRGLIFDGKYINGEIKEIEEYHPTEGDLIFKGKFLSNKYWEGEIKLYHYCNISFESELINGQINGKRTEFDFDKM